MVKTVVFTALRLRGLKQIAPVAVLCLGLVLILAAGCRVVETVLPSAGEVDYSQTPEVGDLAPEFQLPNLEGQTVSLSELAGTPVLLVFWQNTCEVCHEVMPYVQKAFAERAGEGLAVLTISVRGEDYEVRRYLEEQHWSFPVLLDNDLEVAREYHVWGTPTLFFIDEEGIVQDKLSGPATEAEIDGMLDKIMPQGSD